MVAAQIVCLGGTLALSTGSDDPTLWSGQLHSTPDVSKTHYWSDECPARYTVATIHTKSNRVDIPPRSIPLGLTEMVDAKHGPVHQRFNRQLPMYVSPVPDPQTLDVDTIRIPRVVQLFQKFLCFLLVIFPKWSNWLLCLADSNPLPLPDLDQLLHLTAQTAPSEFKIVPTTCLDITSKQLKKKGFSTASSQAILGLFMNYVAKNQMSDQASQVYMVQALSSILSEQDKEDFFLCRMRALKFYIDRTHSFRQNRKRLIKVCNTFFPVTSQKTPSLTGYGWTLSMPMKMKRCL